MVFCYGVPSKIIYYIIEKKSKSGEQKPDLDYLEGEPQALTQPPGFSQFSLNGESLASLK